MRYRSLPVWECGLKFSGFSVNPRLFLVTPCVGVWIEIHTTMGNWLNLGESLPVWECGLKSFRRPFGRLYDWSLPVWECGLKLETTKEELLAGAGHSLCGSVD